ncbi:hypothetical protein PQG83_19330 [Candidatus Nitrospira neomarina]|uniref:Uncharacterized protein n=1 Tax=Candidatus Nitrospira neomarina TaxID=3020899 RepID=A0AA96GKM9_9BACT|nr:hypothetical protein [Candidatus Nitrospira neomarina]WNM64239.1 hypothetical protein PQG83_19330 [Candidatus Nitrospira neomarina]
MGPVLPTSSHDSYIDSDSHSDCNVHQPAGCKKKLQALTHYARSEDQTFLTLPEWYIVYSADEFGAFVQSHPPSDFPYFRSISQFWSLYGQILYEAWSTPSFNWGYHVMIGVIGASFTAEYLFKGLYETTVGAITAWASTAGPWQATTREDRFIQHVAQDYSAFIHATPWYEYPFSAKLKEFWSLPGEAEGSAMRRWERRFEFTMELLFKTAWGWAIKQGTGAGYDPEALEIQAWVKQGSKDIAALDPSIRVLDQLGDRSYLMAIPRYEPFKQAVKTLIDHDVRLIEVAGNEQILITIIAPHDWQDRHHIGRKVCEWPILTQPDRKRVALFVPIKQLHETLPTLEQAAVQLDHLYDF